jgi:hypothetical protein
MVEGGFVVHEICAFVVVELRVTGKEVVPEEIT